MEKLVKWKKLVKQKIQLNRKIGEMEEMVKQKKMVKLEKLVKEKSQLNRKNS